MDTKEAEQLQEILQIPPLEGSAEAEQLIHSAPANLVKLGAICMGMQRIKLDAIQDILTGGGLHQTAMGVAEMASLREEVLKIEAKMESRPEVVILPDESLASDNEELQAASEYVRLQGFITVDSLDLEEEIRKANQGLLPLEPDWDDEPDCFIVEDEPNNQEGNKSSEKSPDHAPTTVEMKSTGEDKTSEKVYIYAEGQDTAWGTLKEVEVTDSLESSSIRNKSQTSGDGENAVTGSKRKVNQSGEPNKRKKSDGSSQVELPAPRKEVTASDSPALLEALEAAQIRHAVLLEGVRFMPRREWQTKKRGVSLHILHDGLLRQWPSDSKCCLTEGKGSLTEWGNKLRSGHLRLRGHSVVLVLQELRNHHVPCVIKNKIGALVRAIRAVKHQVRIYICDGIRIGHSHVVGPSVSSHNSLLYTALLNLHITHDLYKVFYVSMCPYFEPGDGQYMLHDKLTRLGCLHYRHNLFREIGLIKYHEI